MSRVVAHPHGATMRPHRPTAIPGPSPSIGPSNADGSACSAPTFARPSKAPGCDLTADVDISRGRRSRSHVKPLAPVTVAQPPVNSEGVDLTQIRALKRLTPAERLKALTTAANNLLRLRRNVRRP
jgi:hypothetical protein